MPCYYTGSAEGDRALAYEENTKKLSEEVTKLTRLLCATINVVENHGDLPPEVLKWWEGHQKVDESNKTLKRRPPVRKPNKKGK